MLINQTREYAIRAMAWLSSRRDEGPIQSQILAERAGIPRSYLSKVMRQLVVAGLVTSKKGHGGGFQLARAPETISIADVLQAVGESVGESHCAFGWGRCNPIEPCPLHEVWMRINEDYQRWATESTLGDVQCVDDIERLRYRRQNDSA